MAIIPPLQRLSPMSLICVSYVYRGPVRYHKAYTVCTVIRFFNDTRRDSYLRDQLERHGVARNLKGQAVVRRGRNTQSVGSPSTLGAPTPTSMDIPPISPRLNLTGPPLPNSLNTPSRIPTPTRHAHCSGGISSRSNTTALTQGPSQSRLPKRTNYYPRSRMGSFSNMISFQQKSLQNLTDTAFPLSPAAGDLNPVPPYGDTTFNGIDGGPHNYQFISNPSQFITSGNGRFGNGDSQSFAQAGSWSMEENVDSAEVAGLAFAPISNMPESTFLRYQNFSSYSNKHQSPMPLILPPLCRCRSLGQ